MLYESVMVCTIYASTGLDWSTGARFLTDPMNYRAVKPFLFHPYLKVERCIRLKRTSVHIKNM